MTPFAVGWHADAQDSLADIWIDSPDRNAVTRAQHQIDRLLADDPAGNGHLLSEGLYYLVIPPLAVFYSIDETDRTVEVCQVAVSA